MALRWEWRTFGDRFGPTESRLGSVVNLIQDGTIALD